MHDFVALMINKVGLATKNIAVLNMDGAVR